MKIPFTEPTNPWFIYVNPITNKVYLLVPVVGGQRISTHNTCKSKEALKAFFQGGALRELSAYKEALEFDIQLLGVDNQEQRVLKEERLTQIDVYIEAVAAMRLRYIGAMDDFLARPSNLYGIQLRPCAQDSYSRVVNPAFNIERRNGDEGVPLSSLYNAMHGGAFRGVKMGVLDPRTKLTTAVLSALAPSSTFEDIQRVLGEQCLAVHQVSIDFTKRIDVTKPNSYTAVTKDAINVESRFWGDETSEDYMNALLYSCAPDMWVTIPTPPFYSIPAENSDEGQTEHLSILTQFFLATLNVHCKAKSISPENFGVILDASPLLSNELVSVVSAALSRGDDVEGALCAFCNDNAHKFGLTRFLNTAEVLAVKEKFEGTYRTVTANKKENPHMDDFMILDNEATGAMALVVEYRGYMCVPFAYIVDYSEAAVANPDYFANIRADFVGHPAEIPHKNELGERELNVDVETLLARINDEQFDRLPVAARTRISVHPCFQARLFLHAVVKGKQARAESLLTAKPDNTQTLLRTPGIFTDYSGRTFNCTGYEYAYWTKDTHMRRMLEGKMDPETKAVMLTRIDAIDANGLTYTQHNRELTGSTCFNLDPLKTAYNEYMQAHGVWYRGGYPDEGEAAVMAAWMKVGVAQRDLPVHYVNEYFRSDRSFYPLPTFDELTLPRELTVHNYRTNRDESLFPLVDSASSGFGVEFAYARGGAGGPVEVGRARLRVWGAAGRQDLAAVSQLDAVRTNELMQSHQNLEPAVPRAGMPF